MAEENDAEGGVVTRTKTARKLSRPRLFRVLLHNDNFTTREFVVDILRSIFHHAEAEAVAIMLHVDQRGVGVAGVYTHEIAETKARAVEGLAQEFGYPLMLTIEPEDD